MNKMNDHFLNSRDARIDEFFRALENCRPAEEPFAASECSMLLTSRPVAERRSSQQKDAGARQPAFFPVQRRPARKRRAEPLQTHPQSARRVQESLRRLPRQRPEPLGVVLPEPAAGRARGLPGPQAVPAASHAGRLRLPEQRRLLLAE